MTKPAPEDPKPDAPALDPKEVATALRDLATSETLDDVRIRANAWADRFDPPAA